MKRRQVDEQGRARMVDVGGKPDTRRVAVARGQVHMKSDTLRLIRQNALSKGDALATALLLGILGQLGDLFESFLKRSFGVKDSGAIFPGHGGILDRLDSILFAAPVAYYYAWFVFMSR